MFSRGGRGSLLFGVTVAAALSVALFHTVPAWGSAVRLWVGERLLGAVVTPQPEALTSVEAVREQETERQRLADEVSALQRTLGVVGDLSRPRVLSRVLFWDADPARHAVRIALPEGIAVPRGAAVVAPGDLFVGRIEATGATSADVVLLDDPRTELSVAIEGTLALARGAGAGHLTAEFVTPEKVPQEGSAVYTTGHDGAVPEGLLVGWVSRAEVRPAKPFAEVDIMPAADLSSLRAVFVLTSPPLNP